MDLFAVVPSFSVFLLIDFAEILTYVSITVSLTMKVKLFHGYMLWIIINSFHYNYDLVLLSLLSLPYFRHTTHPIQNYLIFGNFLPFLW